MEKGIRMKRSKKTENNRRVGGKGTKKGRSLKSIKNMR